MAYQKQTWENLPSTNTPITAERLNHIENGIEEIETETTPVTTYTETNSKSYSCNYINNNFDGKGEILWENPNPTSSFSTQTITFASSDFDIYEVYYYIATNNEQVLTAKSIKGHGTRLIVPTTNMEYRVISATDNTNYVVGNATDNTYAVPISIIGYKTGLFS